MSAKSTCRGIKVGVRQKIREKRSQKGNRLAGGLRENRSEGKSALFDATKLAVLVDWNSRVMLCCLGLGGGAKGQEILEGCQKELDVQLGAGGGGKNRKRCVSGAKRKKRKGGQKKKIKRVRSPLVGALWLIFRKKISDQRFNGGAKHWLSPSRNEGKGRIRNCKPLIT